MWEMEQRGIAGRVQVGFKDVALYVTNLCEPLDFLHVVQAPHLVPDVNDQEWLSDRKATY